MPDQEQPKTPAISRRLERTIRAGWFTNLLIVLLVATVFGILLLCFFHKPLWEVGATTCTLAITHALAVAVGAKFGAMLPGSSDGGLLGRIKRLFTCPFCGKSFDPREGAHAKPDDPDA